MVTHTLIYILQGLLFWSFPASGVNPEGFALLLFKQNLSSDPEGILSNWNSSDIDPCYWNGIYCVNSSVVSISIPRKRILGFLSPSLGSLPFLRHINLRNNRFFGVLPPELFRARGIQSLVLYGNSFSGHLPKELGNLLLLQTLDLSQNSFNGSIPEEVLQCNRLRILDLHQNNLSGSLPDGFGVSFSNLEKLDLSFNGFYGAIPRDIGNLTRLRGTLDLSHNSFSGQIPASLGILQEKVYIDLAFNNLSGEIPLINRGASAFYGNPNLCGSPLETPCSPNGRIRHTENKTLSKKSLAIIIICDVIGICVAGAAFSACYSKFWAAKRRNGNDDVEYNDIVKVDPKVAFDLEELLKASAFVLEKSERGIVYKVILENGLTLAVRRLGGGGFGRLKQFKRELEAIGRVKHPNLAELRAYYSAIEEKLLIYDYLPRGNLAEALHGKAGATSFERLSWGSRLQIMKGIARGLAHLHESRWIHGDLRSGNVLVDENMEAKISDLGVARLAEMVGLRSERKRSKKGDVYSYGVILLEMISGRGSDMDLVAWIHQSIDDHRPLLHVLDPQLRPDLDQEHQIIMSLNIAISCVHPIPYKRPSMSQVYVTFSNFA